MKSKNEQMNRSFPSAVTWQLQPFSGLVDQPDNYVSDYSGSKAPSPDRGCGKLHRCISAHNQPVAN